jgi:hypothetical protein
VQPERHDGSISGKLLHPDNHVVIRIMSVERIDTVSLDPESHIFSLNNISYGNYILQVEAEGYMTFEQKIVFDKPSFICHDIILSRTPRQISYLFPSSCQNFDMQYFNLHEPQATDSGFNPEITFNQEMDTLSVNEAITISPDTVGVEVTWFLEKTLMFHFPYWKLATVDTVKVTISSKAINRYNDSLDFDYTIIYPVDADYIRSNLLKKE